MAGIARSVGGDALSAGGVDGRKVQGVIVGAQFDEQIEDGVEDLRRPGVGAVDLVDDDDGPQLALEGLAQHEARLRQRAFGGVHQEQGAVGHLENAFDLAAEVGVAGRVDDVDLGAADGQGDVLGQDRDAAFAFQVVGVEDSISPPAVRPSRNRPDWRMQLVDQGRFAMVNVSDDGHIAEIRPLFQIARRHQSDP